MIQELLTDAKNSMHKAEEALKSDLSKLRTGRAHPSLLSHIQVDYYGSSTPLSQVASVSVEGPRMLTVTPWEKNMIAPIEKAIMTADLGLNPSSAGLVIRVPLPPLNEERRKSMVKLVREATEMARVAVRQARRELITDCKTLLKDKDITEDELRSAEENVQKFTDEAIKRLDLICQEKENDLMSI
jgi:ribosome recycling factor